MDNIIYTCGAEYIGYHFPKRKWWDFSKKVREVQMEWAETFSGQEVPILLRILEAYSAAFHIHIPNAYQKEIFQEFIKRTCKNRKIEILLIVDADATCFCEWLPEQAEDINYLAVLTKNPQEYEAVMNSLVYEYGLCGMIFSWYGDFLRYQTQICNGKKVLVLMGNRTWTDEGGNTRRNLRFPKGSLVLDFDHVSFFEKSAKEKRLDADKVSLPVFLDNIIKNRYNSVVNEGLQGEVIKKTILQQNVYRTDDKKGSGGKRKGIIKWKKRKIF